MSTRGKAPRSWMFESYRRDGGKEKPIPRKYLDMLRSYDIALGKRPGPEQPEQAKEKPKTVKMKTIGSNDDAD